MKRIFTYILFVCFVVLQGCTDFFLNLDPLDTFTEDQYYTKPDQFKAAANDFYNKMISWRPQDKSNIYDFMDFGSDLTAMAQNYGRGTITTSNNSIYWDNSYKYIRGNNLLLQRAAKYQGDPADIAQYVAAAKFFRAWHHFFLVRQFGGVPVITTVVDLNSPELWGARNSRYEVIAQVLKDLDEAISDLPLEQVIASADKGHISKQAAQAFKARVLLNEATWYRYVGTTTDGDGVTKGAGTAGYDANVVASYLTEAASLAKEIMDGGAYSLWNYNSVLSNFSHYYYFCLEDGGSNPAGISKSTDKEKILYNVYDYTLRKGNINLSHTVAGRLGPSRKYMDMFLCSDGLPPAKSAVFRGYYQTSDEYKNRDYRLTAYFGMPADGSVNLGGADSGASGSGYGNRKFAAYNYGTYRGANEESPDYLQIRLAEVYLIYAEALYEINKSITDAQLEESINKLRSRAGLPGLTNSFASTHGLDMLEEIRRERAVELFGEQSRFNDLKRWGIAETELNRPIVGSVIEGTAYENEHASKYKPSAYPYGEISVETAVGMRSCLLLDPASNRNFTRTHYLNPMPLDQINLNKMLLQNPGY